MVADPVWGMMTDGVGEAHGLMTHAGWWRALLSLVTDWQWVIDSR